MEFSDTTIVAIISGSISLFVSLIGVFTNAYQNFISKKKLEYEIKNKYTNTLYEKRMALYPTAFKLSSGIKKLNSEAKIIPQEQQVKILRQLNAWVENDAGLFLSKEVIDSYYKLRKALGNNPGDGTSYTDIQVEKLWNARNEFRAALRYDISNLHRR